MPGMQGVVQVDMVVTLHACDTAMDYALAKAVAWKAGVILSVPCCQHELQPADFQRHAGAECFPYGILKERMSGAFTDGLRAQLLGGQPATGHRSWNLWTWSTPPRIC